MVSSAVLGAATGTGLALVIAVTIVVYRYYSKGKKVNSWSSLDRWPDPPKCPALIFKDQGKVVRQQLSRNKTRIDDSKDLEASYKIGCYKSSRYYAIQNTEFNVAKEQRAIQPLATANNDSGPKLAQRRPSIHTGLIMGRTLSSLSRQPSIGSQEQLSVTEQPQIRTYGPDGRHQLQKQQQQQQHQHEALHATSSYPTSGNSSDGSIAPPASPLGSLQPDLYQRRDGPLFLSGTRRSGKTLGQLHMRLSYDFDKSDLNVHLIEAQELAGSEQGGFNDPYVKLTLSPEVDARKRQTPIHRNDPNPYFDQHFKFPVSHEELQEKTLQLQVLDYDRFSRNDVVGTVRVILEQLELSSSSSSVEVWGEISRERKPPEETQEVLISLSYLPSAERLTLVVLKARNLFPAPGKTSLDPFVKVGLLCGEKRVKKKKTAVRKATRCPVWNEAMSFNVPATSLASSAIEICVVDSSSELIGNNAILGSCIVGPGMGAVSCQDSSATTNPSKEHWLHMTHSPRKAVAMWHILH